MAIKGNKIYKALRHNDYYIIEAACSYKHHETKIDDEGTEVNNYRLYFRGFDAYDGTESDFENIKSDEECFLVIVNGTTKVQQFYQAKYYELSNDFRFDGDKYIPIV